LRHLNLCEETLDGIRNHSWSSPAPSTVEGEIVSWADRIAYCAHDLEDAIHARILSVEDLPESIVRVCGRSRSQQLRTFISAVIDSTLRAGVVSMDAETAAGLAQLREFNYDMIYMRPDSVAQSEAMIHLLRTMVDHLIAHPDLIGISHQDSGLDTGDDLARRAVEYVAGMTDRYAFDQAVSWMDYDLSQFPVGMGVGLIPGGHKT